MTRRMWIIMGLASVMAFTAGGVWTGWALANARSGPKTEDCCLDPTCPPGCSEVCPPNCLDLAVSTKKPTTKALDCCDDPTCPPGCSPACPPDCLDLSAKAKNKSRCDSVCSDCEKEPAATSKTTVAKKYICPPCIFCPGW